MRPAKRTNVPPFGQPDRLPRMPELIVALGDSDRTIYRWIVEETFPNADLRVRQLAFWWPSTVQTWTENESRGQQGRRA